MARKNSERAQRQRSKSTSSLRRSVESASKLKTKNTSRSPPRSAVGQSKFAWCVNGAEKPLLATRDLKHTSNTEKTIRPGSSKPKLMSRSLSNSSSAVHLGQGTKPSPPGASPRPSSCRPVRIEKHLPPRPPSGTSFIHSPHDSSWYLNPLHREILSTNNEYPLYGTSIPRATSSLSLRFGDDMPPLVKTVDDHLINSRLEELKLAADVERDRDLDYFEQSRFVEEEALARAAVASPYELELCRLRKEKLRLEESYLLKKKCELELERTRAPTPRWYELKTKQFTTEREKYENLMNNREYWNELLDYRNDLVRTSMQLANTSADSF